MSLKKILVLTSIGILAAVAGIYAGLQQWQSAPPEEKSANAFFQQTLPDLKGRPTSLSSFQGKIIIVNFWATWCAPCVEEMPELTEFQKQVAADNIQIIGIGIDSADKIAEFAEKYRINYPLYVAGMSGIEMARYFGNHTGGLPYTVLIDKQGNIKNTYLGRLKMDRLQRDVAAL